MNHAEQAEKLLALYHEGYGGSSSDQVAIVHALLAINETLRLVLPGGASRTLGELMDANERINKALNQADLWAKVTETETDNYAESQAFQACARQLREVLR